MIAGEHHVKIVRLDWSPEVIQIYSKFILAKYHCGRKVPAKNVNYSVVMNRAAIVIFVGDSNSPIFTRYERLWKKT